jgi:hypothetical protein
MRTWTPSLPGGKCESIYFRRWTPLTEHCRPSTGLLSVQDATSIVHPALGLKATPVAAGELSRTFKDCLGASHKVIEQRKKEHADWARGIDPTKPQDANSDPKGCTEPEESKEDVEKLIKGVSSYAKELKECIVDSGECPKNPNPN